MIFKKSKKKQAPGWSVDTADCQEVHAGETDGKTLFASKAKFRGFYITFYRKPHGLCIWNIFHLQYSCLLSWEFGN